MGRAYFYFLLSLAVPAMAWVSLIETSPLGELSASSRGSSFP